MVVKSVRVTYCDQCGTDEPTQRYTVSFPGGGRRSFDLCHECSRPLQELAGLLEKVGDRGPKKHQQPTFTEEQVEAMVRKARRGSRTVQKPT